MKTKNKATAFKTRITKENIDFLIKGLQNRGFVANKADLISWYMRDCDKFLVFDCKGIHGCICIVGEGNPRVEVDNDTFLFLSESCIKYPIIDIGNKSFKDDVLNLSIGDFFISTGFVNFDRFSCVSRRTKDMNEIYEDAFYAKSAFSDDRIYKDGTIYYPTLW